MRVLVSLFANLQLKIGKEEMILDMGPIEECTIQDVLSEIARVATQKTSFLIISQSGEVRSSVRIVREGKDLQFLGGLQTKVRDGDCLSIFPLLAGG